MNHLDYRQGQLHVESVPLGDIAAGSGRGSQYGLATAIIVIIFLVLATTSALSFRLTKRLEDIYDQ